MSRIVYELKIIILVMKQQFSCEICSMEFTEHTRLERHVTKTYKKKYNLTNRGHNWYAAGTASGYV